MNYAHIYITPTESNPLGVIGEVPGENGEVIKGTELVDVMTQVAKFPQALAFLFHCAGPGGDVIAGDQIYDYMEGLKAEGKQVDTITDGDIGSIMTKPFLAGQKRTIVEGHKLYVHAPWIPHLEGNAGEIIQGLEGLIEDEQKLLQFYKQKTALTDAGLKGLMKGSSVDGTFITADQAVTLRFATHKQPSKIKAYAQQLKENIMATQTIGQKIDALRETVAKAFGAAPAAAVPDMPEPGADPNTLPDGEYPLADGRVLIIEGGQIKEVKLPAAATAPLPGAAPAPAPAAAQTPAEIALQEKITALELANTTQANELKALKDDTEAAAKALDEFKATLTSGKSPAKAFNNMGGAATQPAFSTRSIAQVQAQKREERKKQINRN